MEIGPEKETIIVEPVEDPFKRKPVPTPQPQPEPAKEPANG
jgi:hypothetical protein